MKVIKVTSKGQVTLPMEMRKTLGITTGQYLTAEEVGDRILLTPMRNQFKRQTFKARKYAKEQGYTRADVIEWVKELRRGEWE